MSWNSGYVTDLDYTYGYYRELSPCYLDFALLLAGYEPPQRNTLSYLELGYGQGLSANIHAAAVPGCFYGTDFNPSHAANSQTLARISQSGATFTDDSFTDFAQQDGLPRFDYIVLHGIWSWVRDIDRDAIVDIILRHLKIGGAVYLSYNTLPGWSAMMPLRHILALHAQIAGSNAQGVLGRIESALQFGKQLGDVGARYFKTNPTLITQLDRITEQNKNYVAHEYFNREWKPMYFSELHDRMLQAKLSYACSATLLEHINHINFSPEQRAFMDLIHAPALKETVRDYFLNAQFRRDIYVRGARRLTVTERAEKLKDRRITLVSPISDFDFTVAAGLGKLSLKKEFYEPLLAFLADQNYAPKTIGDAVQALSKIMNFGAVLEAVTILIGSGFAAPAQTETDIAIVRGACERLNMHILDQARLKGDMIYLSSPIIGGGISAGRFEHMFLSAHAQGCKNPDDWASDTWSKLEAQNQTLVKDGVALKTKEENLDELRARANAFAERLPILQALEIIR